MYKHDMIIEGLEYKDMVGMMKPTVHVDEFASKMGDDDDIMVLSFFVRDARAAEDLVSWFEKGYDFVLDADRSPGEIKPSRYLVYVEMRRRSSSAKNVETMLEDLESITEFSPDQWTVHHDNSTFDFSVEEFRDRVPSSPQQYRERKEKDLNAVRESAGLDVKKIYDTDEDIKNIQSIAGII